MLDKWVVLVYNGQYITIEDRVDNGRI